MRKTMKTLALALTVSTGALWAQTTTPQANPVADEPTSSTVAAQPTDPAAPNPPATANPTNQESDALPQSSQPQSTEQSTETPPAPVTEEPLPVTAAPPAENPKPQPSQEIVSGTVVSSSASALVIQTLSGAKLTFVVDTATVEPEVHAKDEVSVEYTTAADGTHHANRVTIATPKKSAAVAAPRHTTPPAPKKPAVAPAEPLQSVAVTPPAPAPEPTPAPPIVNQPAPAAEPLASGATTTDSAENHTLSSDSPAANPLATTNVARSASPVRMVVPAVMLLGGLLFITVLGVRQARREA